jgi:hypothetical protein
MLYPSLDEVLECLNEFYEKDHVKHIPHDAIRNALAVKHNKAPADLVMIMKYLLKKELVTIDGDAYLITYEGKELYETGGFKGASRRDRRKSRNQILRDCLLIAGSLSAAIGTIALAWVEILKHYFWNNPCG